MINPDTKYKVTKFSTTNPGLSDHEAVLIQTKTIPIVQKQQQRKIYLYDKSQWDLIKTGLHPTLLSLLSSQNCSDVDKL